MSGRLAGRVALVFGAGSSGQRMSIGRATALVFAREGALVAAIDRDRAQADLTATMIADEGGRSVALCADVCSEDEVVNAVEAARTQLGTPTILHNNVGATLTGDLTELELAEWDAALAVNLSSVYLTVKHTVPHMLAARHGSIVNVSSLAASRWTGYHYPAYMSAKAAVNQLTVALALRYAADGIRANAVAPGLIDTPLAERLAPGAGAERDAASPTTRSGTPWDVAHAAAFLASDEAAYVNAVCLPVDGGQAARSR